VIFDGHSDLLYDVTRSRLAGGTRVLETRHLRRLQSGKIEGLVLALWPGTGEESFWPAGMESECHAARMEIMISCAEAELRECPWLKLVRTADETAAAKAAGKMYAFLGVEGLACIGDDLSGIDRFAERGVRLATLTWNEENQLATGAKGDPQKGLTALGKQAARRLQARNIIADVSHLNDGGFRDVIAQTEGPIIASHSNCRALCDVRRNLTDEQLRAIRDTGGVVGLNVHHAFVHAEREKQTAEMLARHAAHMADVMGVEHVACGFDVCEYFGPGNEGAEGLEDFAQTHSLFFQLEKVGFSAKELEGIARENFLRVLR
jgi:membrane dipeptidase